MNINKIFFIVFILISFIYGAPAYAAEKRQLIIINKSTNKLAFFEGKSLVKTFSVATGRKVSYTPEGKFKIVNKIKNRPYYKLRIPGGSPRNPLGDRWLGINARGTWGTTYGVHGNNNPASIGTYASAGCIRMYDKEVRWLFDRVRVNTAVYITRSKKSFQEIANSVGYSLDIKSSPLKASQIRVTNNKGKADTITVKGIKKGDIIKIYSASKKGKKIGAMKSKGSTGTISIKQIGKKTGKLYISITRSGKTESKRTATTYTGEQSDSLKGSQIKVTNNKGKSDKVIIKGIAKGDTIKVYNASSKGKRIGIMKAKGSTATLSIKQIGQKAGKIYITITRSGRVESKRIAASYTGEQSDSLKVSQLEVTNNKGKADSIIVRGIAKGDTIKVYNASTKGTILGTMKAMGTATTISIKQLGQTAGTMYISITRSGETESMLIAVSYTGEQSDSLEASHIRIINNKIESDSIIISKLNKGDIIKVYSSLESGKLLVESGPIEGTTITLSLKQLGTTAGTVYITITKYEMSESEKLLVSYPAEEG